MISINEYFDIPPGTTGEIPVHCPYPDHVDRNPSASYNVDKGLFNCFLCGGLNQDQLIELINGEQPMESNVEPEEQSVAVTDTTGQVVDINTYLRKRGFDFAEDLGVTISGSTGKICFFDGAVTHNYDGQGHKYDNRTGEKSILWVGGEPAYDETAVWLTEGLFDAMSIWSCFDKSYKKLSVGSCLGSSLSKNQMFSLRDKTVFLVFDNDPAGFLGAKELQKKLRDYRCTAIILEIPHEYNDPNEFLVKDADGLRSWVGKVQAEYNVTDSTYVDRLFGGDVEDLPAISTGSDKWDSLMTGGFRAGVHVVAAESSVGKSSFAVGFSRQASLQGYRCLYITNEISKRQVWSRIASSFNGQPWSAIEVSPTSLSEEARVEVQRVAANMTVRVGWDVDQIKYASDSYDVIVVDYLQRMAGPFGDQTKQNIDHNISCLSDLARDKGKVIIVISSLNRAGYGEGFTLAKLKESGNIEYVAQSVVGLTREQDSSKMLVTMAKNTRGPIRGFYLHADLGRQTFTDWENKIILDAAKSAVEKK